GRGSVPPPAGRGVELGQGEGASGEPLEDGRAGAAAGNEGVHARPGGVRPVAPDPRRTAERPRLAGHSFPHRGGPRPPASRTSRAASGSPPSPFVRPVWNLRPASREDVRG